MFRVFRGYLALPLVAALAPSVQPGAAADRRALSRTVAHRRAPKNRSPGLRTPTLNPVYRHTLFHVVPHGFRHWQIRQDGIKSSVLKVNQG